MNKKSWLFVALLLCPPVVMALEGNPFLPTETGATDGSEQGVAPVSDSEADKLRLRVSDGDLTYIGEVNKQRVYVDRTTNEYVYVPVEILDGGEI